MLVTVSVFIVSCLISSIFTCIVVIVNTILLDKYSSYVFTFEVLWRVMETGSCTFRNWKSSTAVGKPRLVMVEFSLQDGIVWLE